MRPGFTTTEFYVTLLTAVAPVLTIAFKHDVTPMVQTWAAIAAGVATAVYTVSRTFLKRSQTYVSADVTKANDAVTQ